MDFEVWITLVAATLALLAIPGPVVMLLLGYTISSGRSFAAAAIPGVVLGDLVAMTISLLGAGAILQTSGTLFLALKFIGAGYLTWLGIRFWKSDAVPGAINRTEYVPTRASIMRDAFLVTALNPKDILFFVAFLPQFIVSDQPIFPQIITLEATFLVLVLLTTTIWVLLTDKAARGLQHPKTRKLVSRFGASWLIGAGVMTALSA
ncbi:LysE family translocator [uncultured Roseobacter sp.]|uniref:LysE family translocator n=1 Tax=uncultured Roseobacter sp. TaxID=114847 RepID=UPI00262406E5|nr:LysE family translocator [uncultured Roseobacter sp.]